MTKNPKFLNKNVNKQQTILQKKVKYNENK